MIMYSQYLSKYSNEIAKFTRFSSKSNFYGWGNCEKIVHILGDLFQNSPLYQASIGMGSHLVKRIGYIYPG